MEQRFSDNDVSKRDIPSFIEPRPPLINNPFMRPKPQKGTNLLELFEEDSELEEPELVQVYLRMKPHDGPSGLYEVRSDKSLVASLDTTTAGHGRRTQHNVSRMYTFSKIFDADCSQKKIFDDVVKDNLKKLVEGNSFTLLTYGASGSGKTYTLMGTVNSPGLVPCSLEYVFKLVDAAQRPLYKPSESGAELLGYNQQDFELQWVKKLRHVSGPQRDKYHRMSGQLRNDLTVSTFDLTNRTKYYVWVSFLEIYNEAIYDLLAPPDKRVKLRMREDSSGQVYVKGITQAFVRTGVEAYDVMVAGKLNLVVAATGVHAHSSRSHCIFTITMLTETDGEIRTSCVRLCDLAGCERARATRNTGTRMQESRAINSSLHVLERCLHMLRRNQRQRQALVPYRESKLTRLLGSGLSGSRGEAVSMVVTVNPAPQYAHETKHVLSLAAVAQDIQINNTAMFASTLESSTQDTTIASSAEVVRLRSDNELLQFELAQSQARNKELLAAIDEKRAAQAALMREVVEEAKDMTKEYYEAQLKALRNEMEDKIEEYEAKISVLKDQLSEKRLAKSRLEEEVKHLCACIYERDEKMEKSPEDRKFEEVEVITDSEDESSDPLNQSLEPAFRTENMNRSQVSRDIEHKPYLGEDSDASIDTIKQDDTDKMSEYETGDESEIKDNDSFGGKNESSQYENTEISRNLDANNSDVRKSDQIKNNEQSYAENKEINDGKVRGTYFVENLVEDSPQAKGINNTGNSASENSNTKVSVMDQKNIMDPDESFEKKVRGTYFVRKSAVDDSADEDIKDENSKTDNSNESDNNANGSINKNQIRGTYFVRKSAIDSSNDDFNDNHQKIEFEDAPEENYCPRTSAIDTSIDEEMQEVIEHKSICEEVPCSKSPRVSLPCSKMSESVVSKIIQSLKKTTLGNVSDRSLEQFERLEKETEVCEDRTDSVKTFGEIKLLKEKRTYFDESKSSDNLHVKEKYDDTEIMLNSNQTNDSNDEKMDTVCKASNNLHVIAKQDSSEILISSSKIVEENQYTEKATDFVKHYSSNDVNNKAETRDDNLISIPIIKKKSHFDNIEVCDTAPIKKVAELITSAKKNHDRSPSIVSDDSEPLEPSTMKKLLGENIAKLEVLSTITNVKNHTSMDVFEGFDSPIIKPTIIAPTPTKVPSALDNIKKSIDMLVISQQNRSDKINDDEQETKLKTIMSVDETDNQNIGSIPEITVQKDDKSADVNESQKQDNTIDEFENIYKNISTHRPTQFDLLTTTQEIDDKDKEVESIVIKAKSNKENTQSLCNEPTTFKYNLRHKSKGVLNTSDDKKGRDKTDEVLLESTAKCESKRTIRSLRLRRRKNEEENSEQDNKLKDILNLKKEFSDVTLGLPAVTKVVKDIPSPEKLPGTEERPMLMGIQSCPSKSVQRSRRKLFTPRAEPLEESFSQTGDSSDRVYVPRPSYQRPRARRKL